MGSIDKFGRPLWSKKVGEGDAVLRGPKGEGFSLDGQGHYLVSKKRIKELDDPENDTDAVNKRWVETRLKPIDDKMKIFDEDKQATLNLFLQAMDQSQKAYDKVTTVESTLKGLSNRLVQLETVQYSNSDSQRQ